ncbi:MAG: ABC transporter substrate-binding protein, partial [Actinomycetota bacterium]
VHTPWGFAPTYSTGRSRVKKTNKLARVVAGFAALSLVVAACGGGDDESEGASDGGDYTRLDACATRSYDYAKPESTSNGMKVTYDIAEAAVWDDGSPITVADFKATWDASLNTPGSISTSGYDQVTSIEAGTSDKQVVVTFKSVYAPWKGLFGSLLKAAAVENSADVSGDFADMIPFSGRAMKLQSWSPEQSVFVPNENYWGDDKAATDKVVMVPKADSDTEIASIKAGEVDFIYPQYYGGIEEAVAQDNISSSVQFGGDYEAFYFNQKCGPFADDTFREAFSKSIDRDAVFQQIYIPIAASATLLQCGPIVPGEYCNGDEFANSYDPEGAAKLLEDAGWEKNAEGFWAKDGAEAPKIRWIINTGNTRRENTQAFLIPLLQAAGFNVVADNCDAACYFQQRLPALDYDMAMYISTAPPDPAYLTSSFTCDLIPTEANGNVGQNTQGWCNPEASDLLHASDVEVDPAVRAANIKQVLQLMAQDHVLLPLFQFPKSGFWRTDKVGGPVDAELNNYTAFINFHQWTDTDGDGQVVIAAEQWPECLNPITECANSSWMVWTTAFPLMPGAYATTNDGRYVVTNLLAGEATVEVL